MHLSKVTVRIRKDNACRTLADSKTANVSYHLEAKNGITLWHECFLNLNRTPDSIYVKEHCIPPPTLCLCEFKYVSWFSRVEWPSIYVGGNLACSAGHGRMLSDARDKPATGIHLRI